MKTVRFVLAFLVLILFVVFPTTALLCGTERWVVKVVRDKNAKVLFKNGSITDKDLKKATETTIAELVNMPKPKLSAQLARQAGAESTIWTLEATLYDYAWEKPTRKKNEKTGKYVIVGDDDYHLAIRDGNQTMIAEIPNPTCVVNSPKLIQKLVKDARDKFDSELTATSGFQETNRRIRITGPAFFDFKHGQRGYAKNGIEIHPILKIEFLN